MNTDELIVPFAQGPEKSVLSSVLRETHFLAKARAEGITEDHFHMPGRKQLFRILLERDAAGFDNELVGLTHHLHESGHLDEIGGPAAVYEIYTYAPNHGHFDQHVAILREQLAKRRALFAALTIIETVGETDPNDLAKALREATDATTSALEYDSGVMTAKQAVGKYLGKLNDDVKAGAMPGLSCGMNAIDVVTGGMRPGELWVIGAEPSAGKSVALLQAACATLKAGKRVLVISLEMDAGVVVTRVASCSRSIPFRTFTHPTEAGARWLEIAKDELQNLSSAPLSIHDKGSLTFDQISGIARCEADRHGKIDLLIVDYLQLVEGTRKRNESREQEVAAVSRGLKGLAKTLGCPVFTASQLNDDGRVRESRAIGQDADVLLIVRQNNAGILGLKIRNGVRGETFPLQLNGDLQRFERIQAQPPQSKRQDHAA